MAYTDDAVKAKLSSLQESQESIVTVAQWIMFHRRHSDRTAQLWSDKLKESSSSKRLNLIYLANEVVQQSKARKKDDFVRAFSPIIVEATVAAYKGATIEVQQKLNRVIAVWRDRNVFEPKLQDELETAVLQYDRSRQPERKARLGGSLLSSDTLSVRPEIQPIVTAYSATAKHETASETAVNNSNSEYDKMVAPDAPALTPPVLAGRLSTLLKNLASAESSVGEAVKARKILIAEVEKLLEAQKAKLVAYDEKQRQLAAQKTEIEKRKRGVEEEIMRSLETEAEPVRPDMEPLTPPPTESLTPVGSPKAEFGLLGAAAAQQLKRQPEQGSVSPSSAEKIPTAPPVELSATVVNPAAPHDPRPSSSVNGGDPRLSKRPRISSQQNDELAAFADVGMGDIEQDITKMLDQS